MAHIKHFKIIRKTKPYVYQNQLLTINLGSVILSNIVEIYKSNAKDMSVCSLCVRERYLGCEYLTNSNDLQLSN